MNTENTISTTIENVKPNKIRTLTSLSISLCLVYALLVVAQYAMLHIDPVALFMSPPQSPYRIAFSTASFFSRILAIAIIIQFFQLSSAIKELGSSIAIIVTPLVLAFILSFFIKLTMPSYTKYIVEAFFLLLMFRLIAKSIKILKNSGFEVNFLGEILNKPNTEKTQPTT